MVHLVAEQSISMVIESAEILRSITVEVSVAEVLKTESNYHLTIRTQDTQIKQILTEKEL
ncbi:MAG TPA: hypothetical protein PLY32_02090 [Salinivirgaceae bacterium]|nr:hypothetical protein [Salinivirgaceae bacterium]